MLNSNVISNLKGKKRKANHMAYPEIKGKKKKQMENQQCEINVVKNCENKNVLDNLCHGNFMV